MKKYHVSKLLGRDQRNNPRRHKNHSLCISIKIIICFISESYSKFYTNNVGQTLSPFLCFEKNTNLLICYFFPWSYFNYIVESIKLYNSIDKVKCSLEKGLFDLEGRIDVERPLFGTQVKGFVDKRDTFK